jgi:hypothetical protein
MDPAKALPMRDRLQGFVNALHDAATAHARYMVGPAKLVSAQGDR